MLDILVFHKQILINKKDAHVLAPAITGKSDFLLTLDRKHFMTPNFKMANFDCIILTPGEIL